MLFNSYMVRNMNIWASTTIMIIKLCFGYYELGLGWVIIFTYVSQTSNYRQGEPERALFSVLIVDT